MAPFAAFAPFRPPAGTLVEEALRHGDAAAVGPLVSRLDAPLPQGAAARALAEIAAGFAASPEEACRGADGAAAGSPGAARACSLAPRHRARVEAAVAAAIAAGFQGVLLDRPDAAVALGPLGAGFCPECQRAFSAELAREYGEHFMPVDYLALAREAVAQASGAVDHAHLPFGREFWRFRAASVERTIAAGARAARDGARAAARPFLVAASFEALGPAQLAGARHLDAAAFPLRADSASSGAGLFRLLRAALGRRPCAASLTGTAPAALAQRLARVGAACGVEVVGAGLEDDAGLAGLRRLARDRGLPPDAPAPAAVAECALLYSPESDLWTGGAHREAVERAGDALAALQLQAPVVLRVQDLPPDVPVVLAGAAALAPAEAQALRRRIENGLAALVVGPCGAVDDAGREAPLPWPAAKPAGVKVGSGTVTLLPPLPPARPGALPDPRALDPLSRALGAALGRARRATSTAGRSPVHVVLERSGELLLAHLATLEPGLAQGSTLFLGLHLAGSARRARFQSSAGADERIVLNPSGYSVSTVLPAFEGYAVLTVGG